VICPFADRVKGIEPFRVGEVLSRAKELQAPGRDTAHLSAGELDLCRAEPIIRGGQESLGRGYPQQQTDDNIAEHDCGGRQGR